MATENSWKESLATQMPEGLSREIEVFEKQIQLRKELALIDKLEKIENEQGPLATASIAPLPEEASGITGDLVPNTGRRRSRVPTNSASNSAVR